MLSIIIPARNEIFLQQTIDGILKSATGEIEILVGLDGYWPKPAIKDNPRVTLYHSPVVQGMRTNINNLVRIARGEHIMKCDAHCAFAPGFDEVLKADCEKDWIVIPRRYSLDPEKWGIERPDKIRDAHYLSHPTAFVGCYLSFGMHVKDWVERTNERKHILIDDEMTSQGSCWFMHRNYFQPLSNYGYGTFIQEFQEIGLRCWLTGGRVVVNKKTWYAHLWKGKRFGRMYDLSREESLKGQIYSAAFWYNNHLPNRIHDLEWLIDKFSPVPSWEDWKNKKIEFPPHEKIMIIVPEIPVPVIEKVPTIITDKKTTRDETVAYILKRTGHTEIGTLPMKIDLNRSQWGKLFHELGFKIGAEIGVYAGEYSEVLCKDNPGVKHYCVDPYSVYDDYANHKNKLRFAAAEAKAKEVLAPYNCIFIRKPSMEAVKEFEDNSLDYVYIDGNHEFVYVAQDIHYWQKKVRPGGIVSGHDFDRHRYSTHCHALECVTGYTDATGVYPWFITSFKCRTRDTNGNWCRSWMWVKA